MTRCLSGEQLVQLRDLCRALVSRDLSLVAVSAGVSDPSSSRLLADRITGKSLAHLRES